MPNHFHNNNNTEVNLSPVQLPSYCFFVVTPHLLLTLIYFPSPYEFSRMSYKFSQSVYPFEADFFYSGSGIRNLSVSLHVWIFKKLMRSVSLYKYTCTYLCTHPLRDILIASSFEWLWIMLLSRFVYSFSSTYNFLFL